MQRNSPCTRADRQLEPPERPPARMAIIRQRFRELWSRRHEALLIGIGMLIALGGFLGYDLTKPPPQNLTQRDINAAVSHALASATPAPSFATQAYEIIRPSLVRVNAMTKSEGNDHGSLGAGVAIDDRGTILTSLHVVKDAVELRVVFADGTESEARTIATDPANDLAVLLPSTIPDDLTPATMGNSRALSVGDEVVAVGNPFGISNSLSAGVVSGLGRFYKSPRSGETLANLIQFDAAVNPGNSGGPLLDRHGEVVGIVTALLNPTDQDVFIGIGFAVPIETAATAAGVPPY